MRGVHQQRETSGQGGPDDLGQQDARRDGERDAQPRPVGRVAAVRVRVRVGVGRPPGRMDTADYVLKRFSGSESKELPLLISEAADAVEMLTEKGLVDTQQYFHARLSS